MVISSWSKFVCSVGNALLTHHNRGKLQSGNFVIVRTAHVLDQLYHPARSKLKINFLFLAPSDWNFVSTSEYDIVGYLVTTGPRFYQLCPVERRQSWFDEFQRSNFKCLT